MSEDDNNGHLKEELLLSPETIDKVYDIHEWLSEIKPIVLTEIPQMHVLLSSITASQQTMAAAAASMASTNEKAEERYARLEDRLQSANDRASGRAQIPLVSHYLILGGTILCAILVVLYFTKQTIDASLTTLKVGQDKNLQLMEQKIEQTKGLLEHK